MGVTNRKALLEDGGSDNSCRRLNLETGPAGSSTGADESSLGLTVKSNGIATDIVITDKSLLHYEFDMVPNRHSIAACYRFEPENEKKKEKLWHDSGSYEESCWCSEI